MEVLSALSLHVLYIVFTQPLHNSHEAFIKSSYHDFENIDEYWCNGDCFIVGVDEMKDYFSRVENWVALK